MWWHRRDQTPKSSRTFPPVATHGLIGKRKSAMADRSKSRNGRRDHRTSGGLTRNERGTMKARSATLTHRLGLALVEGTHAALAGRTPINEIMPQLSQNPATHDLRCPKTSRGEIVCKRGRRDAAILRIIPFPMHICSTTYRRCGGTGGLGLRNQAGRYRRLPRTT